MKASERLKQAQAMAGKQTGAVEVDVVVSCRHCYSQPDVVYYNRALSLLFWKCPEGHEDYIEEFDLLG